MEFFVLVFGIAIVFTIVECQIQMLKDKIKEIKKEKVQKPKQFKREHTSISKTNFRKHVEGANRYIC